MSFIFDALRKSEERRRQGSLPDLHLAPPDQRRASVPWRPALLLLLAILLLNAAALLWWLRPWQPSVRVAAAPAAPPVAKGSAPQEEGAAPVMAASASRPEPKTETPVAAPGESAIRSRYQPAPPPAGWLDYQAPPAGTHPAPSSPPTKKKKVEAAPRHLGLPRLEELPAAVRQTLPALTLSLHYYTAEATTRLVRLNGKVLRQGDSTDSGLLLEEITPSGVILRQGELRFLFGNF